jgi:uncharacterized membrane protein YoaK (UPF0700 family)
MLFVLAYVEAVCYLGLFHTLTGYISGATILLATEFFRPDGEVATNLSPLASADAPATMLIVVISVLAMSLHNVHSLQVMPEKAKIAITGLFVNFAGSTIHLFALLRAGKSTSAATAAFRQLLYPLIAFFGGAFLGVLGFSSLGFIALACPIATLIVMAAFSLKG